MVYKRRSASSGAADGLGTFVTGCLAGIIIGGVLGLLLAPHRGDITRRKRPRHAGETRARAVEAFETRLENMQAEKGEQNGNEEADS